MVSAPNPSTAAAGAKILASTWNADVRDADTYFNDVIGGIGPRNVLINSHMDVWQRGSSFAITSSATPQYHADRWCTRRSGATGATVSRQTGPTGQKYAMRVQRDSGNSNTTAIETMQPIESLNSLRLAGQTCQLKLTLKAGANFSATSSLVTVKVTYGTGTDQAPPASGWTGTTDALSTTQAITTTATDYTFDSISIPTTATQVQVYVSFTPVGTASTNDWFELSGAQLTAGKASGWERRSYGDTLALCQRYCRSFTSTGILTTVGLGSQSMYYDTNQFSMQPFGWDAGLFRTAPTMLFTGTQGTDWAVRSPGGVPQTGFTVSWNGGVIFCQKNTHGLAALAGLVVLTSSGRIDFSAEL